VAPNGPLAAVFSVLTDEVPHACPTDDLA
jgi:hypothetical protein